MRKETVHRTAPKKKPKKKATYPPRQAAENSPSPRRRKARIKATEDRAWRRTVVGISFSCYKTPFQPISVRAGHIRRVAPSCLGDGPFFNFSPPDPLTLLPSPFPPTSCYMTYPSPIVALNLRDVLIICSCVSANVSLGAAENAGGGGGLSARNAATPTTTTQARACGASRGAS